MPGSLTPHCGANAAQKLGVTLVPANLKLVAMAHHIYHYFKFIIDVLELILTHIIIIEGLWFCNLLAGERSL